VNVSDLDIPRLSSAIRRLAKAASANQGSDCYIHATIAQALLSRLGFESILVVGYAAWRVGPGNSDIIMHAPTHCMVPQEGGLAYHVWLEVGDRILDLTTYSLREKAGNLDQLDGGHTTVDWCPDFLFVEKNTVSPMDDVRMLEAGMYFYSRIPVVETKVIECAPALDEADVEAAWMLYQNPDMKVFGPNDVKGATTDER
jgi:hypothetical protein